jgi:hypothetical protein
MAAPAPFNARHSRMRGVGLRPGKETTSINQRDKFVFM